MVHIEVGSMITYKLPYPETLPDFEVPVLHKIYLTSDVYHSPVFKEWLETECSHNYYTSPSWAVTFVEFEDDEDAVMCALKWA